MKGKREREIENPNKHQMIEELGYEAQSFPRCRIINYKEIILPIEE